MGRKGEWEKGNGRMGRLRYPEIGGPKFRRKNGEKEKVGHKAWQSNM
jgi:hypothetical protein